MKNGEIQKGHPTPGLIHCEIDEKYYSEHADFISKDGDSYKVNQSQLDTYEANKLTENAQFQKVYDLKATDQGFIRVTEDLIDTLISKNIITLSDLPTDAQEKVNNRKTKRADLDG